MTEPTVDVARRPAADAELALLLEVAATPTPGNVDRRRDLGDLRFEHLLAGAVGSRPGLEAAATGRPLGTAFERAVAGMSDQSGGNTQFGALLLLSPLLAAAGAGELSPASATRRVDETTVDDAVAFYRAFEQVEVGVDRKPPDVSAPDVGLGGDAEPALRDGGWTLSDVMAESAGVDAIAREWTVGFERTFEVADEVVRADGPLLDRAASAFIDQLATYDDTHVAKRHDPETAARVRERAAAVRAGEADGTSLAESLVESGINPGATADILAAGLFVALRRGVRP